PLDHLLHAGNSGLRDGILPVWIRPVWIRPVWIRPVGIRPAGVQPTADRPDRGGPEPHGPSSPRQLRRPQFAKTTGGEGDGSSGCLFFWNGRNRRLWRTEMAS